MNIKRKVLVLGDDVGSFLAVVRSLGYRPPVPATCSPRPLMLAQPEMIQ